MLSAAKEALAGIPEGLSLRTAAADYWFQAATALGDQQQAVEARWEAFRAAPIPRRLLDLRDAAGEAQAQQRWMKRALSYGLNGGLALVAGPQVGYTGDADDRVFLEKGDGFIDYSGPFLIGCIRLLVGLWRTALADAKKESVTAWDGNIQGLVILVLLAWSTGWPAISPPTRIAALLEETFAHFDGPDDGGSHTGTRFRQAMSDSMSSWEAPSGDGRSELISECIRLTPPRVSTWSRSSIIREIPL